MLDVWLLLCAFKVMTMKYFFSALILMMISAGQAAEQKPSIKGRLLVEWDNSERFIFRRDPQHPLRMTTSTGKIIEPLDIYTDGGSIPQFFQNISGLSPWNLGPAYIIHDWLFQVHGCAGLGSAVERAIEFDESANILGEAGYYLLEKGRIKPDDNKIFLIKAAVSSFIAKRLWDKPPNCARPPVRVDLESSTIMREFRANAQRDTNALWNNFRDLTNERPMTGLPSVSESVDHTPQALPSSNGSEKPIVVVDILLE